MFFRSLVLLIIVLTTTDLYAQLSRNDSRINDAYTDLTNRIKPTKFDEINSSIEGSPYFDSKFHESTVVYFGKELKEKIFLRYNAFSDELEMSTSANAKSSEHALMKNNKIYCKINNMVYKYFPLKNGNELLGRAGYVREIYRGDNFSLYHRKRKIFREGKKARTSLERSFPPRFVDEKEWYLQKGEYSLEYLKLNKKHLKSQLDLDAKQLDSYLKKNKNALKSEKELKRLVEFFDTNN